jgi:hypothetical protein
VSTGSLASPRSISRHPSRPNHRFDRSGSVTLTMKAARSTCRRPLSNTAAHPEILTRGGKSPPTTHLSQSKPRGPKQGHAGDSFLAHPKPRRRAHVVPFRLRRHTQNPKTLPLAFAFF